ncbi:hypothetical protein [Grimontia sp. SpTr1]|uniref:hypothetical protein n=1 Tax=Grimontia sp. SpTr1 TaxID=2995319 RepID=UPI00248C820A|nr:hypothetical protein [Grimontia sp. SpTr1]
MHPLQNGSQVAVKPPAKNPIGEGGYFTEGGQGAAPSYPGADWFNAVISEFLNALTESGVTFEQGKFDHLVRLMKANGEQFSPYRSNRKYKLGDVVSVTTEGQTQFFEYYSNLESVAGKDPLDPANRQSDWSDLTKPFYWTPFKKARPGTPLWPWLSMTFPEGTLNVAGNSVPAAVFWRLATALPEFVNSESGMIDFPETGGEFFRVLDQGRGVDANRGFNHYQPGTKVTGENGTANSRNNHTISNITNVYGDPVYESTFDHTILYNSNTPEIHAGTGTYWWRTVRPRNRAFPLLIEV